MTSPGCRCVQRVNKALAPTGFELHVAFTRDGKVHPTIAMLPLEGAKRPRRRTVLTCNFCPFCGRKYPDTKKPPSPKKVHH